jgi:hypothetical protein
MTRRRNVAVGFVLAAILAAIGALALRHSVAEPAAPPTITLSPEVRALLDQVRLAYGSAASLSISGAMQANLDIDGTHGDNSAQITGLYSSGGLFRNETKDVSSGDPASPPTTSDAILGNTGSSIYLFFPERNRYEMMDAPKGKVNLETLGEDVADILRNQNL